MQKNGSIVECTFCGKEVYVAKYREKAFKFCSHICHAKKILNDPVNRAKRKYKSGKENPHYKGGYVRKDGYRIIYVDSVAQYEHRYVVEKHLGVKLTFDQNIHHKDGNKLNNNIENLEVISRADHISQKHPCKKNPEIFTECRMCNRTFSAKKYRKKIQVFCSKNCMYSYIRKHGSYKIV